MNLNIDGLNKIFDNRIRIGIMSALVMNDELSFKEIKELLNLTDGNLASHVKTLEDNNYLVVEKSFIGRKTNTTYKITKIGRKAFEDHINYLEKLINKMKS